MHWLFEAKTSPRPQPQPTQHNEVEEYPPTLEESDYLTMITLQDKYSYYKSLIRVQQVNHINEDSNEKNMLKVMTELIEYYAQCITQAERNVQNIVRYFQLKIKNMNNHYKKVFDRQKTVEEAPKQQCPTHNNELGNIEISIKGLQIPEPEVILDVEERAEKEPVKMPKSIHDIRDLKSNLNKTIMMALQSQNIQEHLRETTKKADFLKKSIASSIQMQEQLLERRLKEGKKKKSVKDNVSNPNTTEANSILPHKRKGKKCNTLKSAYSDGELDQAESLFIQNFVMEDDLNLAQLREPSNPVKKEE